MQQKKLNLPTTSILPPRDKESGQEPGRNSLSFYSIALSLNLNKFFLSKEGPPENGKRDYLCLFFFRGLFQGTNFVTSWYTHRFASTYLESYNFLTIAISIPENNIAHFLLLLWGLEAQGDYTHWC